MNRAALFATFSILLWGCSEDLSAPAKAARARWLATKPNCGTYHYSLDFQSFSGRQLQTSIEITGDTPTARMFFSAHASPDPPFSFVIDETWTEVGADVGTHSGLTGAAVPRTMEQLYERCLRDVLTQDPEKNVINFEADTRGALAACIYFPRGCVDDCGVGDIVSDFACEPLDLAPIRP